MREVGRSVADAPNLVGLTLGNEVNQFSASNHPDPDAITVDDAPLDEPYLAEPMEPEEPMHFEVPEGSYFMLGDNRNNSRDARYWKNTYVAKDKIIAKVLFCYFPNPHVIR